MKNKKGFTLIELLAVIVILAILVMVAIPAVTRYLNTARQGAYADNAKAAVAAVRNDVIINGFGATTTGATTSNNVMTYKIDHINKLLEKQLVQSPFGGDYDKDNSYIKVTLTESEPDATGKTEPATFTYTICLLDKAGRGIYEMNENDVVAEKVSISTLSGKCTPPTTE